MKTIQFAALVFFSLTACTPQTPTPPPTVEPIRIAITPALAPLGVALQACATPQAAALQVETIPANSIKYEEVDLVFHLGESSPLPDFVAPIAWESLQVVLHPELGNIQLDEHELAQLFSGQINNWSALGRPEMDVTVWVPLAGADQRVGFEDQLLANARVSPLARLAPSPQAMLEAVSGTPGSIGYLPTAWDTGELRSIDLELTIPVLALATDEPGGATHDLVVCLQSEAGQQILSKNYTALSAAEN
ncbi:MAG: hypothetical protein DWQ07_25150 [Chloroflexi bacterium]|nr:MAG: hypothetical protein DWQ07_25150 [Chloroflexota bacterium]MBL1196177.1 hypothetical protein [Chloroflexota bacterium]NOH13470.1 hypothetical protein [Chloroflexota bacterium]